MKVFKYWTNVVFAAVFQSASGFLIFGSAPDDPDVNRNVTQLITSKGYPAEEHAVLTEDGFVLSLQRILRGRKCCAQAQPRNPVLLVHGLFDSADAYVINSVNESLGYVLADSGYDVWLGNCRTNKYSNKNIKYTSDMAEYWDYSFDEIAKYDIPAMIHYILRVTGKDQIYYIGHSQGSTACFALLSESPEFNKKIKLFVALAPVVFVTKLDVSAFLSGLSYIRGKLSPRNATPGVGNTSLKWFVTKFLKGLWISMANMSGAMPHFYNETRSKVYMTHYPDSTSTRAIAHFFQLKDSKTFSKYNYGKDGNLKHYKQPGPPEYDLGAITTPTVLVWTSGDAFSHPEDIQRLSHSLRCPVEECHIPDPEFNHLDFLMGYESARQLSEDILRVLGTR